MIRNRVDNIGNSQLKDHYQVNNFYIFNEAEESINISPNISAYSPSPGYSSISEAFDDWPIGNKRIYSYLLPEKKDKLSLFIKNNYKSSCAVLYVESLHQFPQVIGTGVYIGNSEVITARHVIESFSIENIYIRFFNYDFKYQNGERYVIENTLNISIKDIIRPSNGLDMVKLKLFNLVDPTIRKLFFVRITPVKYPYSLYGKYIMFHFAGGEHQVSIGIQSDSGSYERLINNLEIFGGNGASGAPIILSSIDGGARCYGISIYRLSRTNSSLERRIIPLQWFPSQNPTTDYVAIPYSINFPQCLSINQQYYSGSYEFLQWSPNYIHYGMRSTRPASDIYNVSNNHSNHHIIPIYDLMYLWDYFHTLEPYMINIAEREVKKYAFEQVCLEAEFNHPLFNWELIKQRVTRHVNFSREYQNLSSEEKKWHIEQIIADYKNIFTQSYEQQLPETKRLILNREYGVAITHLNNLCAPFQPGKNSFSWGCWNLFQGYNRAQRADDPSRPQQVGQIIVDFSEKKKPRSFPFDIWRSLKVNDNTRSSLYQEIHFLKQARTRNISTKQDKEAPLIKILEELGTIWNRRQNDQKRPHLFNQNDWRLVGMREGQEIYQVQ